MAFFTCASVSFSTVGQHLPHYEAVRLHKYFSANKDVYAILTIFHQHVEENGSHLNNNVVFGQQLYSNVRHQVCQNPHGFRKS